MSQDMEERIAHLEREVADLSGEVSRQAGELSRLGRRIAMLLEREAEREADGSNQVPLSDQTPPHW